jgi:histidinol-phosphatase (PHP family)
MLLDYHTHHYRCGHARGVMEDYIQAALAVGLKEIGVSDHSPIYHLGANPHPLPRTAMSQLELPHYIDEALALQQKYAGRIAVKIGVESDYLEEHEAHYRSLWAGYPLDYVIGSVHWLGTWNIFYPELPNGMTAMEAYLTYLNLTGRAAASGIYEIIGHLDCLKTRGHLPDRAIIPPLEEAIRALADSGVAIELNTSGWRKECAECYPRAEVLARCHHWGVPVTFGSDAHDPHLVGAGYAEAVRLLKEIGYTELASFTRRRRTMLPLD